jgi:hypothetical protein
MPAAVLAVAAAAVTAVYLTKDPAQRQPVEVRAAVQAYRVRAEIFNRAAQALRVL